MTQAPDPARGPSDYGQLLAAVTAAGLLERGPARYLPRLAVISAVAALGLVALVWVGDTWWQLGLAVLFAVVFAQLGFLGHDAGHQQVFRSRRANDLLGMLVATLGVGLSYGWWVDKHNRHHRSPNQVGRDPDVARNVIAWTDGQAAEQRGLLRWIAQHQAGMFFPLLLLEGWNLHVGSVRTVVARRKVGEAALLLLHAALGIAVLAVFMSPVKVVAFIAVQQCLFGLYLGSSFAPNHKGMPVADVGEPGHRDFLRRQVLTARNVSGGRILNVAFGALNYQIEHHLFPSMPSRNLSRCQPLVRRFCAARGVPYVETSLITSYAEILRYLHSLRPCADAKRETVAVPGAA
jgi:fatty acid desaturase